MRKFLKWLAMGALALVAAAISPILYVELACRGEPGGNAYTPVISEPEFQRQKANTYLTYPEWHIVYAYEGLAETLKTGDEYRFDYLSSIGTFWSSYCALNRTAQSRGGADLATRQTIYVIGVSFSLEMAMKAAYEETLGRLSAAMRGPVKTPQDEVAMTMAADYAAFLYQTPWYKYPFPDAVEKLWAAPVTDGLRGWERRLALSGEWKAKTAYAAMIAKAVAATGVAKLEIRSVVTELSPAELQSIPGVQVIESKPSYTIINTPRYAEFTAILVEIANRGGKVLEIAGNDEILVTAVADRKGEITTPQGTERLAAITRTGFGDQRILLNVKVSELTNVLKALPASGLRLEHVYDY
jgi:hypothetical protein